MSAVLDVKHKKPAIDHLVIRLSLNEARDLLAAYKVAHDTNHYFFNVWGRLPELVNQIAKVVGPSGLMDHERAATPTPEPVRVLTIEEMLKEARFVYDTNPVTAEANTNVRTQP